MAHERLDQESAPVSGLAAILGIVWELSMVATVGFSPNPELVGQPVGGIRILKDSTTSVHPRTTQDEIV